MPAGGLVTLGVGAALGGAQWIKSAHDANLARKAAAANVRPVYETPQSEQDLYNLTASQAGQGLSDSSRAIYEKNANQGLASVLAAMNRGGADPNGASSAYGNYETGINNLALQDNNIRLKHLSDLASVYQRQTANSDKEFQLNKFDPYKDRAQAIAQQMQAAQQGQQQAFNTIGSSVLGAAKSIGTPQPNYMRDTSGDVQMQPAMQSSFNMPTSQPGFTPMYNVDAGTPNMSNPRPQYGWNQNYNGMGWQ